MTTEQQQLHAAYQHCQSIAQNHYENFPVASRLLSHKLRYPISVIYAFARSADDFADEGQLSHAQRYELLDNFAMELHRIEDFLSNDCSGLHCSDNAIFIALADVLKRYQIPIQLFHDLLQAFKSDVSTRRYANFDEVLSYCCLSANPVGRILLYLNNSACEDNLNYSDAICTGLQLINFYQDISQDMEENDRLYIPMDELQQFDVSIHDIKAKINNAQTKALMSLQIQRAKRLYDSGKPLCSQLSGRFGWEIRTVFAGGSLILEKLQRNVTSIYERPRLTKADKMRIFWRGLITKY